MSRALQITCDGCGKPKQISNNWWIVGQIRRPGAAFSLFVAQDSGDPFDERYILRDFCGSNCALKYISEQLGKSEQ